MINDADYNENKIYSPIKPRLSKKKSVKIKESKHHKRTSSTFYNSQKYRTDNEMLKVYSFGKKWHYDDCYKNDESDDIYNGGKKSYWYVAAKREDLKTEILQNASCSLSMNEWKIMIFKATYL